MPFIVLQKVNFGGDGSLHYIVGSLCVAKGTKNWKTLLTSQDSVFKSGDGLSHGVCGGGASFGAHVTNTSTGRAEECDGSVAPQDRNAVRTEERRKCM